MSGLVTEDEAANILADAEDKAHSWPLSTVNHDCHRCGKAWSWEADDVACPGAFPEDIPAERLALARTVAALYERLATQEARDAE